MYDQVRFILITLVHYRLRFPQFHQYLGWYFKATSYKDQIQVQKPIQVVAAYQMPDHT